MIKINPEEMYLIILIDNNLQSHIRLRKSLLNKLKKLFYIKFYSRNLLI